MWGTDMTATVTVAEGPAVVFVAVDHGTAECSGLHAAKHGTRFEALEPIRQGMRERFGGIGDGVARGLRLRHDHGSNSLADDFQQEVAFFGIESSPSVVREPEGSVCGWPVFILMAAAPDFPFDPDLLRHVSPIEWKNVILYGEIKIDPAKLKMREPSRVFQHESGRYP